MKQNAVQFYQAVEMAVSSCEDVSSKKISNCFRHCGFFRAKCSNEIMDEEYDEFKQKAVHFKTIVKEEKCYFEAFVNIDDHLSVAIPLNEHLLSETVVQEETTLDINGDLHVE